MFCDSQRHMRREGGKHSCVTGTKLYGNLTIKNLTTDRCTKSWSGNCTQSQPYRHPFPKTMKHSVDMRYDPDDADPTDPPPRHYHSKMNDMSASAVFGKFQSSRGVRAKIIQRSHKEGRQQLRASVGRGDFALV